METESNEIFFDVTPDEIQHRKPSELANNQLACINVVDGNAGLAWLIFDGAGNLAALEPFEPDELETLGISEDLLDQDLKDIGGISNISGQYPLSKRLQSRFAASVLGSLN